MTAREAKKLYPDMWNVVYRSIMRESHPDYDKLFLRMAHNTAFEACTLFDEKIKEILANEK